MRSIDSHVPVKGGDRYRRELDPDRTLYRMDQAGPGDTTGQDVGKIWWVVTPTAGPLVAPTPAS